MSAGSIDLSRHAPLFRNLVRREARQRYKGSSLGLVWTLVNPLIAVAVYALVFRYLFKIQIDNYALFLFVGLAGWTFFFGGAQVASTSLVGNANLVKKVSFPREVIPLSSMTANSLTAVVMFAIAVPLCLVLSTGDRLAVLALPVPLVLLTALTIGLGLIVAALNVYFRDIEHILAAIALPWMFLTPIYYTYDTLPLTADGGSTWIADALHWGNPVSPFFVAIHESLFFGRWPDVLDLGYAALAAAAVLGFGWWLFQRLEGEMAVEL
jgi:ABC-2 type transport system permease protein